MNELLLKIQNFSKTITTLVVSIFALVSSGFVFKALIYPQSVVIEQIYVPSALEERGLKSEIVIQRILDDIQKFRQVAKIDRAESAIFGAMASKPDADIDASFGGVSLKSIEQVLASVFDRKPKKISGEITIGSESDRGSLHSRIRIENRVISDISTTKDTGSVQSIVNRMAFDIYKNFEPFRAALAAARLGRADEARDALRPLVVSTDATDRKYALWLRSTLSAPRPRELDLLEAVSIDPKFTLGLIGLAVLERDRKNFEASRDYAERAIESNPTSPMGYHEKGRTLRDEGRLDDAISEFKKACAQKIEYAPCFNQIGEIALMRADRAANNVEVFRGAYSDFSKAIRIDPGHAWAHSNAAYAALRVGDLKDAQLLIKRAMELDPASLAHAIRYAGIAYRLGNRDEALSLIRDLLPKMPNWEQSPPSGWGHRVIIREILK